jgi:hypothetical protein
MASEQGRNVGTESWDWREQWIEKMKVSDSRAPTRPHWTSRRVPLPVIGFAVLAMASFLVVWFCLGSSRLRAHNVSAVRAGMTRAEVEALLGGPAGDYGYFPDGLHASGDGSVLQLFAEPTKGPVSAENWLDDNNSISIFFNSDGRVVAASKARQFKRHAKGGVLEFVRRRIGTPLPSGRSPPKP